MNTTITNYETYIEKNKILYYLNKFVNSYSFVFIIGLLVFLSSSFAIEVVCFPLIALLGFIALLVSKDTKPIIPIVLTFLMGMSYKNGLSYNPNPELPNIYDNKGIGIFFFSLMLLVILGGIINQFLFKQYKTNLKKTLLFLPGALSLSLAYILAGAGTSTYVHNIIYSCSNVIMILVIYMVFTQTAFCYQDKTVIKYLSIVMLMSGLLISLQVGYIYLTNDVVVDGYIHRGQIVNGWGLCNNFSAYLVMSFPFVMYLMLKEKHEYLYMISAMIIIFFNVLCQSRNGLVMNMIEIIVSIVLIFIYKRKDKAFLIIGSTITLITITSLIIFHSSIASLFKCIFESGLGLNGRGELYETAWNSFLNHPLFGEGWFIINDEIAVAPNIFSPNFKVHDIILQLLGSTGILGLIAFIIYCTNIGFVTFKNFNVSKLVFALAILVVILSSIFDNFFFDYGFERYLAIFLVGILGCTKEEKKEENITNN